MKKVIVIISAAFLSLGIASAQDFEKATNLAKDANEALMNKEFKAAIDGFNAAVTEASACTQDGVADLVASCKKGVVLAQNGMANALIDEGKLDAAIEQLKTVMAVAAENDETEIAAGAEEKMYQLHQAIANAKMKAASTAADPAEKVAAYKAALENLNIVLDKNPDQPKLVLQKGQILSAIGQKDAAIEAFEKAKELGMEDAANKQLSTIYLKDAAALNKAQKFKEAVAAALKSIECQPNANAYKIAGVASQKAGDIKGAAEYLEKYVEIAPTAKDVEQMKAAAAAFRAQLKK